MKSNTIEESTEARDQYWFDAAGKLEDTLRHIGNLADNAFNSIVDHSKAVDGHPKGFWTIPNHCHDDVVAILFAIRATAALAQESRQ